MIDLGQDAGAQAGLWGTVVAVQANYYRVQLVQGADALSMGHRSLLCTRRARLKKLGQRIMVGDRVWVEKPDWQGGRGAIATICPRETELQRPPVANANQMLLMFALAQPDLDPHQLTRFLVTGATTGLPIVLCLNKQDLISEHTQDQWRQRLQTWGYTPLLISLHTGEGIMALQQQLSGQLTVISGPSGVGKSSLINQLIPDSEARVGAVSDHWGQGKHTTRHVELFELPEGGLLADTPGFNQPSIQCSASDLAQYFPEVQQRLAEGSCQFKDCLHRDEPHCVVRGDWERYPMYLTLLDDALAHEAAIANKANPETTLKRKSNRKGDAQYEPKLSQKRYRRPSRRTQKQQLRELYPDSPRSKRSRGS